MPDFIRGLDLCRTFFNDVVQPIIHSELPDLKYSAALIGPGSEVLGFDTEMSTDHAWGPRLLLFLPEEDEPTDRLAIDDTLIRKLPAEFRGYPTDFAPPESANTARGSHRVEIHTIRGFLLTYLGFDIGQDIEPADWLTFPEQKLRSITAGAVFHDEIGLQDVRNRFEYYPHDVWLYLLAAGWNRIGQEDHLMGRAGFVGDEIGSVIIASRLVRDLMRLCFLMERQYAPYPKWFGTAFAMLQCSEQLSPILQGALQAATWQVRGDQLAAAYEVLATMHDDLHITDPLPTRRTYFHERPFKVIDFEGTFPKAICEQIQDPVVRKIAEKRLIGSIDQISDNTDIVSDANLRGALRRLYE